MSVPDDQVPLARPAAWALLNLLAAIGTVALGGGMAASFFRKRNSEEEEEQEQQQEQQKRKKSKLLGILPSIGSVIAFLLTEDMRNPMALTDKWTLLMAVLLIANAAIAFLTRNKKAEQESGAED